MTMFRTNLPMLLSARLWRVHTGIPGADAVCSANLFNARIVELSESLIPFKDYNVSESTVTVKVRAWTTTYQTAEFTFSQEMYPTEEKIDKLKKQALRLLPEKIRKETDWQAKGLVLRNVDIYVLVDGMNDKSAEEKVALELKI